MTSDSIRIMTLTHCRYQDYLYRQVIVDGISCLEARHHRLSPVLFSASILLTGIQIQESLQFFAQTLRAYGGENGFAKGCRGQKIEL